MNVCSAAGCAASAKCKGMCMKHYSRTKRNGHTRRAAPRASERLEWLKAHVQHESECCLPWPFGRTSKGYGNLQFQGRQSSASRVMCTLAHGEAPTPQHEAAHACGAGANGCVNPQHLRWATRSENHCDALEHGTHEGLKHQGASHPSAKLDDAAVLMIRSLVDAGTAQARICEEYGLSSSWVSRIVNRKCWTHI